MVTQSNHTDQLSLRQQAYRRIKYEITDQDERLRMFKEATDHVHTHRYSEVIDHEQLAIYLDTMLGYQDFIDEYTDAKNAGREVEYNEPSNLTPIGPKPEAWTAAELLAEAFTAPREIVPGILPEGLTILASRPKMGKTWLGLGSAVAIASGGRAFGHIAVDAGDVLYLALEDGPRRIQTRLRDILHGEPAPKRLDIWTKAPGLDNGILIHLQNWIDAKPNPRAIFIDTIKRVRPRGQRGGRLYDEDYEALAPLADIAQRSGVAIVAIHHTRKMDADDPLDLISGTTGLTGAADGAMVLKRDRGTVDAVLHVVHRDLEDKEHGLRFDAQTMSWILLGDADDFRLSEGRKDIIDALTLAGALWPRELSAMLNVDKNVIRQRLFVMMKDGNVIRDPDGKYRVPKSPTTPNTPNGTNSPNTPNGANGVGDVSPVTSVRSVSVVRGHEQEPTLWCHKCHAVLETDDERAHYTCHDCLNGGAA